MQALVLPYDGHQPELGEDVFLAPGAKVVGQAQIGDRVSVWYNAIVRADVHWIKIGADSNIQDGAVLHGQKGEWPVELGERVSVGHQATVHGAIVEHDCLVGIGARVLDGCRIGHHSLIAAGAVVREGTEIPPYSLVVGVPAQVKRSLTERELDILARTPERYREYAQETRRALTTAASGE
jgi:carbonic anhydrase/acetyltransferase-like protein (isoleucine patch superfamily)